MTLDEIRSGMSLAGVEPDQIVSVVAVIPLGSDTRQLVYRTPTGALRERLLSRADEDGITEAIVERPWAFDGDGEAFQLACEAKRIDYAFLFDPMMAVHTSNVDPLPHQITAVYESMLPRQPLRFVLADDPGAGKTIMAGLYMRELILRADARRILVVAPGSLVEQWRDELLEKFDLRFEVYTPALDASSPSGNALADKSQLIVRLDQLSRNEELQERACREPWDLIVFDEAHKLAAHFFGSKLEKTARFRFAERAGAGTRHLLLMTATPHNGKEEDFQLFLSLLDSDRFYGKFRDGVHKVDTSDLMRRMVKEELVKFDGTPLFPERRAYTVNYELSDEERTLYEAVTHYVKTEMGKADALHGGQKGSVGFALTTLQRRLASSPEAIYQSLRRRRERLERRLREERQGVRGRSVLDGLVYEVPEDEDELDAAEQENLEEVLVDEASASSTFAELEGEIHILKGLEQQAHLVVASGRDRKWDELSKLLQHDPTMREAIGERRRKLILFTEHRDTLHYLHRRIADMLGDAAVLTIHGGTHRDERRRAQALFRSDPEVTVLIATDAAGEGVNLQVANLMVNYDLPWNPNRLEQRFGRIHRIGQTEVCHLWNLVAKETREGEVYHRLLAKLEVETQALQGRVFDILGEVFEEKSLKELLIEAIRYGDQPEVRRRLTQRIDRALDREKLQELLERNALAHEAISPERLFAIREELEKAEARKLQPFFVRSFFLKAMDRVGATVHPRELGRYEVTFVPAAVRERDRLITGRKRRHEEPVLKRYERICFTKDAVQPLERPGLLRAVLMHPGHPLMLAVSDLILEQHANLLRQGALFVDPSENATEPYLLFLLSHEVKSGDGAVLSQRMQFVRVSPEGETSFAGWAPHLDLQPLSEADRVRVTDVLEAPWVRSDAEQRALAHAAGTLAEEHFREVAERRVTYVDRTLVAVHERLTNEIAFWQDRWMKLNDDQRSGLDVRLNLENVRRTITDLEGRLEQRKAELKAMRHVMNATPHMLGVALVVPEVLLREGQRESGAKPAMFAADATARAMTERIAMNAVRRVEEAKGHRVLDVSAEKCGWDLTSYPPATDGRIPEPLHLEVKGRARGADTVTVTRNEILYACNQAEKFVLALVLVGEDDTVDGPYYLRNPFDREPGWGVSSINYSLGDLLARAEKQPSA
jgi:superfamily II DNA or RNA helicase